ncbi:MAG: tetratricopeptide repeat protein [Brumimicrobium sp.]|nr:tetratricopeptide repeat protein [Brumimicrobium sp.]
MKRQEKAVYFERVHWLNKLSLLLLLFISFSTFSQVEELKKKYPKQQGKERVLTLLDLCYYLAPSNNTEAIRYGRMANEEAQKIGDSALLASVWNDWSIAYFYNGDLDSSLLLNQQAFEYRSQQKDTMGMAKSLNKIANTYYEMGIFDKSLKANLTSLHYFKQLNAPQFLCQVYTNIGNIYDRTNKVEKGLEFHTLAIEEAKQYNNQPAEAVARINRANDLRILGRPEEAKKEYLDVLPLLEELHMKEHKAGVYQGLGVIERDANNLDLAIEYYEHSLKFYRDANAKSGISLILVNLGNCYIDKKAFEKAEPLLKEGLELALEMHSYYNIRHAYKALTRLEILKGNYEKADEYFDFYIENMDSIYNDESTEALAEMQVKYDTEANKLALAEEKIKTKNTTIWLIIAAGSIFFLILIVLYIAQKKRIEVKNAQLHNLKNLERERIRIARDLHDNLGAELTMITSKLDAKSFKAVNEAEKSDLNELGAISRNANIVLRETIWSIHKEAISIDELVSKTEDYLDRINVDNKITTEVIGNDLDTEISPAIALHLFRIIQETSNNAIKYANCNQLKVEINGHQVSIADDGIGFNPSTVKKGYGLQNIEIRAKEMNATLIVESTENNGTLIVIKYRKVKS